ncbi:MAG: DoxX family protein [Thermoanaerobaculia bacterium]
MQSTTETAVPTKRLWVGRVLSALAVLFLIFDGVIKVMVIEPVVEASARLGLPVDVARGIGILELVCVAVYLIPRTSVLGAVLLTGFLGGAIAIHVRIGDPLFSHVLFPAYVGALLWGGLFLREDRLRALLPVRS